MFDVGFAELFLIGLVGLIVLGPERLPAVARTLGGLMRKARASWASLRSTIEAELAEADIANPIKEFGDEIKQIGKDLKPDMPDMNSILKPESKSSKKTQAEADADAGGEDQAKESQAKENQVEEGRDKIEKPDEPGKDQPSGSNL